MSEHSAIEWTDATWNPVRGCDEISPGCDNCYARTFAERWRGVPGHPYEQGFDIRTAPDKLNDPLRWTKPRRVFVNSMSDLFHARVPFDYVDRVVARMALSPWHTYQVLTKRASRLAAYLGERDAKAPGTSAAMWRVMQVVLDEFAKTKEGVAMLNRFSRWQAEHDPEARGFVPRWPLPNVWWGVSVEDRKHGLPRIEHLRDAPAAVRFLSIEPLLEDLGAIDLTGIHWVIVGGESGHGARPFDVEWARAILRQCSIARVPAFVKQFGGYVVDRNDAGFDGDGGYDSWPQDTRHESLTLQGWQGDPVRVRLRDRKGGDWGEWPEDLRVRQFPEVRYAA